MDPQPYTIDTADEANAFLTDLLANPKDQSMGAVERRCDALVKDPAIKAYFLATGAKMLAEIKDRLWNEKTPRGGCRRG